MKITDVRCVTLGAPLDTPIRMAHGTMRERTTALVEIETDEGLTGIGESWTNFPSWAVIERRATIEHGVRPLLLGQDPLDRLGCWQKLVAALVPLGRQWGAVGPIMQALSGMDIALWDLAGKVYGRPVAELLGAPGRLRLPCYASGIGPTAAAAQARRAVEAGFTAVKLKLGFDPESDRRNVREVRQAVGSAVTLLADGNQAWDPERALEMARFLADHGIRWLEEPVPSTEPDLLAEVARRSPVPIAAGENVYGREAFRRFFAARALRIAQPDVTKTGGISEAKVIADMAGAWRIRVAPHFYGGAVGMAATLHFFAAVSDGLWIEWDTQPNPLRDALVTREWEVRDGHVRLPSGPGLGIELDPAGLERFRVA